MAYVVRLTGPALKDAEEYHGYILRQSYFRQPADDWFVGLLKAVNSLADMPSRCAAIPEQERFTRPLRHLLYESHRIIFEISGDVVTVHRIYHSSLRPLGNLHQRPKLPNP